MKKFLASVAVVALTVVGVGGVASAAPVQPAECTGVYSNVILTSVPREVVTGTSGNDLVFVNHKQAYVNTKGGNDCVVVASGVSQTYAMLGAGADVAVDNSVQTLFRGEGGADKLYTYGAAGRALLDGGAGNDTCVGNLTTAKQSCEQ